MKNFVFQRTSLDCPYCNNSLYEKKSQPRSLTIFEKDDDGEVELYCVECLKVFTFSSRVVKKQS